MDQQTMTIPIWDLVTPERAKEIAEEELRLAFRQQFKTESDVERVLTNLTMEYVFALVAEQWDGDFSERLRKEISRAIEHDHVRYEVFRRKVYERLREYEQADQAGCLLRTPVPIGTDIWIITSRRPKVSYPYNSFVKRIRLTWTNAERWTKEWGINAFSNQEAATTALKLRELEDRQ